MTTHSSKTVKNSPFKKLTFVQMKKDFNNDDKKKSEGIFSN